MLRIMLSSSNTSENMGTLLVAHIAIQQRTHYVQTVYQRRSAEQRHRWTPQKFSFPFIKCGVGWKVGGVETLSFIIMITLKEILSHFVFKNVYIVFLNLVVG